MNASGKVVELKLPALFEAMAKLQAEIAAMDREYAVALLARDEDDASLESRLGLMSRLCDRHEALLRGRRLLGHLGRAMGLWCNSELTRRLAGQRLISVEALSAKFRPLDQRTFTAN